MFRMMSEAIFPLFVGIPITYAHVNGSDEYSSIEGMVLFYPHNAGSVVVADIGGLPTDTNPQSDSCSGRIYGFHIHEGIECSGTAEMPFANAGAHFSKAPCEHPYHTGDMPVLFENSGRA